MKKGIFVFVVLLGSLNISAQDKAKASGKKSCAKTTCCAITACGPSGTKVSEAKIITKLRDNIVDFKEQLKTTTVYSLNEELLNRNIPAGENDNQSIKLIDDELTALENELAKNNNTWQPLSKEQKKPTNKAKQVSHLYARLQHLKAEVPSL